MILTILKIRLLQFYRLLKEVGLLRIIILLPALVIVSIVAYNVLILPEKAAGALIVIGLLLLSAHASRKDKHFIKIVTNNPYPVYLGEYLLLTFPVFIIWSIHNNWIGIGTLALIVCIIPVININISFQDWGRTIRSVLNPLNSKTNSKAAIDLPFISKISFEWRSGIRKHWFILALAYLLFLAFSFKPFVAQVAIITLSLFISGFYFYGEPREFIELFAKGPREFIFKKIFMSFKQSFVVFAPIMVVSLLFQPSTWVYLLAALLVSLIIQGFTIVFKYALFAENSNLNRNIFILLFLSLLVSFDYFLPVPFIVAIWSYKKALKNLKPYLHD